MKPGLNAFTVAFDQFKASVLNISFTNTILTDPELQNSSLLLIHYYILCRKYQNVFFTIAKECRCLRTVNENPVIPGFCQETQPVLINIPDETLSKWSNTTGRVWWHWNGARGARGITNTLRYVDEVEKRFPPWRGPQSIIDFLRAPTNNLTAAIIQGCIYTMNQKQTARNEQTLQALMWHCLVRKCDPLCEIQAKVSKSNYEITSIKIWFQPLISLISIFDMILLILNISM